MGKKKRMALIVLGAGVCLVTIFFFLLKLGFENDLMDGIIAQDEVLIRTQLADTFVAKYETRNFPKLLTTVEIYDLHHNQLGSYHLRDYFQEPQFPVLFDQPNLRIYQTPGGIIYKDRTGRFNGVQFTWITAEDFIENPELVEVAKILIETKEWRWLRAFGRFPVIFGDDEVRNILVRYSLGRFTEEELAINQDSKLTKADMIIFAQQVLEEYKRYEVEIIDENKVITFADKNLERVVREKISKPAGEIKFSEVQGITVLDAGDLPLPRHRFHDVSNPEIHEKAIVSLDGLRYLTNLQELNLSRNPISDLSELKYLKKLTKLELATIYLHQEGESDLSPLSELTLKHLGLFSNHIADISPLASLVNLEYLDLSHNEIRDITPIANLTNLRELNLGFNHIEDISPLSSLTKLQKLHLSELGVEDLAPLANLKNLEYLVLFSLPVKSIDVLSNLKNLTTLQLSYLEAKTEDLFILKKLKKLTSLSLQGFTIEDLSFLESLNQLTELDLTANHIKDISTLANLTELEKLSLCNNPVSEVESV